MSIRGPFRDYRRAAPDGDRPIWKDPSWRKRTFSTTGADWTAQGLTVVGGIVAARALGAEGYGSLVLAIAIASFVATLLDVTLEEALLYFGTMDLTEQGGSNLRELFRRALSLDFAIGVAVLAGLLWAAGPLVKLFAPELTPQSVRVAALIPFAATVRSTAGAALLIAKRPDLRAVGRLVDGIGRVALLLLVALTSRAVQDALLAISVATLLGSVVQLGLARKHAWRDWPAEKGKHGVPSRELLRFATHTTLISTITGLLGTAIPLILGRILGVVSVARWSVAATALTGAGILTAPMRVAAQPALVSLWAKGDAAAVRRTLKGLVGAWALVGTLLAVAGYLLLPIAIPAIYGENFRGAVPIAQILVLGLVPLMISGWAKLVPGIVGRPVRRTRIAMVELVLTIGGVSLAAAAFGLRGAATAYLAISIIVAAAWVAEVDTQLGRSR